MTTIFSQVVRPSVRPNFLKSSDIYCRAVSWPSGSLMTSVLLIHSANPKSRQRFLHMLSVRPSPLFKSRKTKQKQCSLPCVTMGLAEWIIDDFCVVLIAFVSVFAWTTYIIGQGNETVFGNHGRSIDILDYSSDLNSIFLTRLQIWNHIVFLGK